MVVLPEIVALVRYAVELAGRVPKEFAIAPDREHGISSGSETNSAY